jgi:lauroyl/myristoyl acyltransferase
MIKREVRSLRRLFSTARQLAIVLFLLFLAHSFALTLAQAPEEKRFARVVPWGRRIYRLWKERREIALTNIALIRPDFSPEEVEHAALSSVMTLGADWAFLLGSRYETVEDVKRRVILQPGLLEMAARVKAGEKLVAVLDHTAPVDGGATAMPEILGINAAVVVQKTPAPIRGIFDGARASWNGTHLVSIERGRTYKKAEQYLQKRYLTAVLIDIFNKPRPNDVVCHLGDARVSISTTPARLARNNGAAVWSVLLGWDPITRIISFDAYPLDLVVTDDADEDIQTWTKVLGDLVCQRVYDNPHFWMQSVWQELST